MKQLKTILIFWMIAASSVAHGQTLDVEPLVPDFLDQISGKDSLVDYILRNKEKYRFQFMLTDIAEEDSNLYISETYDYTRPDWYFYPASLVKLPAAIMSLEKLKELDFSTNASIHFDTDFECGNMRFVDESNHSRVSVTFKNMIRELIIVSNNTYYNSLYHFLTPQRINDELAQKGCTATKIYRDYSGCEMPLNLKTHGFSIKERGVEKNYHEEGSRLDLHDFASNYTYDTTKLFGSKHEYRREIVDGPFDFNYNLEYPITDIHSTSMRLFFPEFFTTDEQWDIRKEDREFLLRTMKAVPKNLWQKEYQDKKKYPDNLYKYLVKGDNNPKYDSVITYSKLGLSYGFVTETAYVHDPSANRHYVLTVSLYVNSNNTVNDGKYDYEELAKPFLARFGQLILEL